MNDEKQSLPNGISQDQKAEFTDRMLWVIHDKTVGVVENGGGFDKRDSMFGEVSLSFSFVPLKP